LSDALRTSELSLGLRPSGRSRRGASGAAGHILTRRHGTVIATVLDAAPMRPVRISSAAPILIRGMRVDCPTQPRENVSGSGRISRGALGNPYSAFPAALQPGRPSGNSPIRQAAPVARSINLPAARSCDPRLRAESSHAEANRELNGIRRFLLARRASPHAAPPPLVPLISCSSTA
jgi:hypothetical protein